MFSFERIFEPLPSSFNSQFRCYSVSMLPGNEREAVEDGGKIIMPPSALDVLTRLNIVYPMLFKLTNVKKARTTHSGVLEFVAEEGKVHLPYWMMRNLLLEEGDFLQVKSASLPIATFAQFQPQSVDFLDISNPKAVLENALRTHACLTKGDMVAIRYNDKIYELFVMETKPGDAVSIIECDMQVDFATPVGYVDPKPLKKEESAAQAAVPEAPTENVVPLFPGKGQRLDGRKKRVKEGSKDVPQKVVAIKRGIPDLAYKVGKITFKRIQQKPATTAQKQEESPFSAFQGEGNALRKKKY